MRLLGQDSELLLQWPEMQAALRKIPALAAAYHPRTILPQQLNTWTRQLLAKMVVEVRGLLLVIWSLNVAQTCTNTHMQGSVNVIP